MDLRAVSSSPPPLKPAVPHAFNLAGEEAGAKRQRLAASLKAIVDGYAKSFA